MKKVVTLTVAIMCVAAMFAAPWSKKAKGKKAEASGYTFGEEKTFRSEKPVTYSISSVMPHGMQCRIPGKQKVFSRILKM